jgi:phosphinothricin acetyltransferase
VPEVRPATEADLPAIVEIYNRYVVESPATFETSAVTVSDRRAWFQEHRRPGPHRVWVASAAPEGPVLAWASTSAFRSRAAYSTTVEASVYCRPEHRGQGLGTAVYSRLFDAIREEDVARIVAGVTLPNEPSLALHARFGFRHVGTFTRVGRKFDRYWDVAWFERPARIPSKAPASGSGSTNGPGGLSASR